MARKVTMILRRQSGGYTSGDQVLLTSTHRHSGTYHRPQGHAVRSNEPPHISGEGRLVRVTIRRARPKVPQT